MLHTCGDEQSEFCEQSAIFIPVQALAAVHIEPMAPAQHTWPELQVPAVQARGAPVVQSEDDATHMEPPMPMQQTGVEPEHPRLPIIVPHMKLAASKPPPPPEDDPPAPLDDPPAPPEELCEPPEEEPPEDPTLPSGLLALLSPLVEPPHATATASPVVIDARKTILRARMESFLQILRRTRTP
jgi:hypothetical protein